MPNTKGVGALSESEVTDFIKDHPVGVLTLVDGDKPYSVVLEHYFDGQSLYFGTSPREDRRKNQCIKQNANACYTIYDSRRELPELVEKGIRCRSVLIEGKIGVATIKEIESKEYGPVRLQMLKLEVGEISNWVCPGRKCDWQRRWYDRRPELVSDI
jgi:nitroimidazol reductase NimA-like FMN-containing flavoprotein (pyridoxamine 5'-phosphate oxidase superfamily)